MRRACVLRALAIGVFSLFAAMLFSGCFSPQPFKEQESWLVRENSRPHYFALFDIFYLAPTNYTGEGEYPYDMYGKTVVETVNSFGVHTRVFAPIYRDARDVEKALDYYLDMYHGDGLPWPIGKDNRIFVFVGEGLGAEILKNIEQDRPRRLRRKGFLGGWYSPDTTNGFVTETLVRDVTDSVRAEVYRRTWGGGGK